MTKTQLGKYSHGVFGYPVEVTLEPATGGTQVSLADVVSISISLTRSLDERGRELPPSKQTDVTRDLETSIIVDEGSPTVKPMVRWTVAAGDFPEPGSYLMELTFNFSDTQRFISKGLIIVE